MTILNVLLSRCVLPGLVVLASGAAMEASADESADQLAKQLANPVSSLISVPFQFNAAFGGGPEDDGEWYTLNIQPVVPISIAPDWNLIVRTIVPIVGREEVLAPDTSEWGFGNTLQSFFFSPKAPTSGGLIWGVGPAFLLPTATDGLASNQWGVGVTGVGLTQTGPWTIGALANHLWSITGNSEDGQISSTFLQPFVSYTLPSATSFTLNTESTYDWENDEWSVPVNATVGQIVHFGSQPVQLLGGVRYWASSPDGGPKDWGARLAMTFLFAK